jgi:hypothetical protein
VLFAVGISRFASMLDGLRRGLLEDPDFAAIVKQDLTNGQHRNPTQNLDYFTETFFHHPDELRREIADAGLSVSGLYGIEGPSWLPPNFDAWWENSQLRERLLEIARTVETEPTLIGVSAHILAVARRG